jgi:hypothetical protein
LKKRELFEQLKRCAPHAHILGCSTVGEICGTHVTDDSLVVTAVYFEHTQIRTAQRTLRQVQDSFQAGKRLAQSIPHSVSSNVSDQEEPLTHILVLSDGLSVDGSDLVYGLVQHLPRGVTVTGGLAGDGAHFKETFVFLDQPPAAAAVAVLGLYGTRLRVGFGSLGGWVPLARKGKSLI